MGSEMCIRDSQLVGYGVVVGLAGSGDGNTGITLQSMQSLVSRFGVTSDSEVTPKRETKDCID